MAALTKSRPLSTRVVTREKRPLAAATQVYKGGGAVCVAGFMTKGSVATGQLSVGYYNEDANNAGAAGALSAEVVFMRERRVVLFNNDGTNPVVAAGQEGVCYFFDDNTVSSNATGTSKAGLVYDVTTEGVWVELGVFQ